MSLSLSTFRTASSSLSLHGAASASPERQGRSTIVQSVFKDSGGSTWPLLTKTKYADWSSIMKVKLQAWQMWEAVKYNDVDDHEDRWPSQQRWRPSSPRSPLPC